MNQIHIHISNLFMYTIFKTITTTIEIKHLHNSTISHSSTNFYTEIFKTHHLPLQLLNTECFTANLFKWRSAYNIIFWPVHNLWKLFNFFWSIAVKPLWYWTHRPYLICYVLLDFFRDIFIRVDMEPLHSVSTLKITIHSSINSFLQNLYK